MVTRPEPPPGTGAWIAARAVVGGVSTQGAEIARNFEFGPISGHRLGVGVRLTSPTARATPGAVVEDLGFGDSQFESSIAGRFELFVTLVDDPRRELPALASGTVGRSLAAARRQ